MQKFSPRKDKSDWSESNKKRVKKLIEKGLITQAGLEKIEVAKKKGNWDKVIESARPYEMAVELDQALASNRAAKEFFNSLSPAYQKQYIVWIASAKKEETRQRRAKEALAMLIKKKKLGLK
ncbi:MAG: YdeI/OmpD-associated family protein [Deltaproteobacteria bacterium]|nr:YdeI/OmpD-associated family protein [Deltaproteobacteria bacterium]